MKSESWVGGKDFTCYTVGKRLAHGEICFLCDFIFFRWEDNISF